MSKIERYAGNLRAFGSNAQGLERTLFGETTQADDLTSQVTSSFLRGWGIVGPSENPSMEDFNAAMYTMSQFIAYQHQMGIPEWDDLQEYYSGSICVRNGEAYLSLVDSNIGSAPPSAKWTSVLTAKNALANISGFLKSSNNLSEIKTAGPAAVAQTLLNLGLGDVAKRTIGTGNNNVPDIAIADNRYLKQSGGTVVGDAAPIIIRAATLNAALYLLAQQSDGSGAWYLGMPVAENNRLVLRSYANNCEISLSSGRGDITVPLYIEGGKAYYPGNKPPLTNVWVSGEYTPVMATPTVVNHGLAGIDVLHCKADVLLKCVTADAGYSPGDFAAGWSIHSSANAATVGFPALSTTTIQTNTGAAGTGLLVNGKGGGGSYSAVLANWRYILRIFY
ncbi:TPA: hypothetical protein ACYTJQ_000496 [Yersinia enterocolitica]|nr:hypothetical protein [Yersinia enterocolitica]HEC1638573.1 hypothetical protein [Yersinia enterocolitica]